MSDAFSAMVIEHPAFGRTELSFDGDLFELEDQRNWGDASFKTYCTPLLLGFPHQARKGVGIMQSVTIRVDGESTTAEKVTEERLLSVGHRSTHRFPVQRFQASNISVDLMPTSKQQFSPPHGIAM
jgi:hypothetical protein